MTGSLVGLSGAIVLALALLFGHFAVGDLRRTVQADLDELAGAFARRLDEDMGRRLAVLRILSGVPSLVRAPQDPEEAGAVLTRARQAIPAFAWLGVAGADGRVLAATDRLLVGVDVSARPWFAGGLAGLHFEDVHDARLLGSLLPPRDEPPRFVDIALPVRPGELVLGAHIYWAWARDVWDGFRQGRPELEELEALIFDANGQLLLGPADARGLTLPTLAGRPGWLLGRRRSTGFGEFPGFGWTVVVRQPVDVALRPVHAVRNRTIALGCVALVPAVLLALALARLLRAPLLCLTAAVARLRDGQPGVRIPALQGPAEIVLLAETLQDLLDTRAYQTQALHLARDAARRDPLTGLLNRAGLAEGAARLARVGRREITVTVLLLDLDGFKLVNDTHGHGAGDTVLRVVAERLQRNVRPGDMAARLGGDEFALLVPLDGDRAASPENVVERLLAAMRAPIGLDGGATASIGASIGVAFWRPDREPLPARAMEEADRMVYAAKRAGRNCARVAAPPDTVAG